jgi:hypothetical protein
MTFTKANNGFTGESPVIEMGTVNGDNTTATLSFSNITIQ